MSTRTFTLDEMRAALEGVTLDQSWWRRWDDVKSALLAAKPEAKTCGHIGCYGLNACSLNPAPKLPPETKTSRCGYRLDSTGTCQRSTGHGGGHCLYDIDAVDPDPAPAASPPACRPWCGEGVNRPPRPETHYVRDGRRWCHDGRINHDRDRDRARAAPRDADEVLEICRPAVEKCAVYPAEPCEQQGRCLFACWRKEAAEREPSRPGTGDAVDFDPAIHCSAEEFQVRIGRAKQRLGVPPAPPAPGKPASRETMHCNTCGGPCDGPCEEGDEQWEAEDEPSGDEKLRDLRAPHEGASEMGPGKPDEAPLSPIAARMHDAWWNGRSINGPALREMAKEVAVLESYLVDARQDIEGWKLHNALLREKGLQLQGELATRTAEVESLRAAATAQVARIAELERDVVTERENVVTLQDIARREERERIVAWQAAIGRQPFVTVQQRDEGIASGAPAPKATP